MKFKVLAADDEKELLDALELYTERENITLIKADNGISALDLFEKEKPHMVLLDVMMPGLDGFSVLKRIRNVSNVPAIMLTARSEDYDKILGLELGADDYITKPYNPMEVVARMKAGLRRNYSYMEQKAATSEILSCGGLTMEKDTGVVKKNEQTIELTKTEFLILELLLQNKDRILTKQQIFEYAWAGEYVADDNTIMVHISNLRAKIEDNPKEPKLLKTIKGLGYKLREE